jgi:hypothetical protein
MEDSNKVRRKNEKKKAVAAARRISMDASSCRALFASCKHISMEMLSASGGYWIQR